MLAKDIMTRGVKTIHSTNSIRTAIELMINRGVSGLPVVDEDDIVIGIITEGDLLRRVEGERLRRTTKTDRHHSCRSGRVHRRS